MRHQRDCNEEPTVFVWRFKAVALEWMGEDPFQGNPAYSGYEQACPFCAAIESQYVDQSDVELHREVQGMSCRRCGFWWCHERRPEFGIEYCESDDFSFSLLKEFAINDARLGLDEIGSHLRSRRSDAESLTPRRFEFLVGRIFERQGYSVRFTKQTRDDGYDLVLLENATGDQILVECKRYSGGQRVSISAADRLLGVMLRKGIRRAKIVTTSGFTLPAREAADEAHRESGRVLELVDAEALAKELEILDMRLPPLHANKWLLGADP